MQSTRFRKIVVAIHGVGDQSQADTIRSVATQFGTRAQPRLPLMPLGYFSVDGSADVKVSALDLPPPPASGPDPNKALREIGFAEVYWADIPREANRAGDTIEETKAWGRTVVSRAEAVHKLHAKQRRFDVPAFDQAAGVIEEIVDSVRVIENITTITDKMGLFKFDVAPLLRDYVNDVQVVTEFPRLRGSILARFHKAMNAVLAQFDPQDPPEIHIVAHSEGTVVSFMAMLQALAGEKVRDLAARQGDAAVLSTVWIRQVRGFMTIGSPIDKHLLLWEKLWEPYEGRLRSEWKDGRVVFEHGLELPQRIDWRNYYDRGDPIGFELDTARAFLKKQGCAAFDFPDTPEARKTHDMGFTRYPLPGKAHVDYWTDRKVFGHFIDHVVLKSSSPDQLPRKPPTRWWAWGVSYALPYLLVAGLMLAAVFVLFRGLDALLKWEIAPSEMAVRVAAVAALLLAVTVVGRMPRLIRLSIFNWKHWVAMPVMLLAAAFVGRAAHHYSPAYVDETVFQWAAGLALVAWLMPRLPRLGRPVLMALGLVATIAYVMHQARGGLPADHGPLSGMALAIALFMYLWWLAIMLFDLAFIWHRYTRFSVSRRTLHDWRYGSEPGAPATATAPAAAPAPASVKPMIPPDVPVQPS